MESIANASPGQFPAYQGIYREFLLKWPLHGQNQRYNYQSLLKYFPEFPKIRTEKIFAVTENPF